MKKSKLKEIKIYLEVKGIDINTSEGKKLYKELKRNYKSIIK